MLTLWTVHGVPPPRRRGFLHPRPTQSPFLLLSSGLCSDKNLGWVKNRVFEVLAVVLVEGKLPSLHMSGYPRALSSWGTSYQKTCWDATRGRQERICKDFSTARGCDTKYRNWRGRGVGR